MNNVIKRNNKTEEFDSTKIFNAIKKAFITIEGNGAKESKRVNDIVQKATNVIVDNIKNIKSIHIEQIQNNVEIALMDMKLYDAAKEYTIYRNNRSKDRNEEHNIYFIGDNGNKEFINKSFLFNYVTSKIKGLTSIDVNLIIDRCINDLYDNITWNDIIENLILTTRTLVEKDPEYSYVAARFLLESIGKEYSGDYKSNFKNYLTFAISKELISPVLLDDFDIDIISDAIEPDRDLLFGYLGMKVLYDRYLLKDENHRFELPQYLLMRVAMGLSINEINKEEVAIDFYNSLSNLDYMTSTPTLFNSGTLRSQLSSCYVSTVPDDLAGIFSVIKDNAMLSKFAGGLGNDWTPVRAIGSHIKGTNGVSSGVVPFLKVANDVLVAVNQSLIIGTKIITNNGIKSVEDVDKDEDLLLTSQGTFSPIQKIHSYNCGESLINGKQKQIVEIKTQRQLIPLKITDEHPIFVMREINRSNGFKRQNFDKKPKKWINAGELIDTDMIAHVVPIENYNPLNLTPDDVRFYGIVLGDGHVQKRKSSNSGVSLGFKKKTTIEFVKKYLTFKNVPFWEIIDGECIYINWTSSKLPWINRKHIYDNNGKKIVHKNMLHLPKHLTVQLLIGLIETDGYLQDGKYIHFTTSSINLAESVRYIVKKFHILSSGHVIHRDKMTFTNREGEKIEINKSSISYDISIPAFDELAKYFKINHYKIPYWVYHNNMLFERVNSVDFIDTQDIVYDFVIDGDPSYTSTEALVHNGGRRRGSGCAYLESWHLDINDFCELRKNTGHEYMRTHDMNIANWINDEFMERVKNNKKWMLFSPNEVKQEIDVISFEDESGDFINIPLDLEIIVLRNNEEKEITARNIQEGDIIIKK